MAAARATPMGLAAWVVVATTTGRVYGQGADVSAMVLDVEKDAAHAAIASTAVAHANEALERALRFRQAGDEAHARAADGLAREWGETARDIVRTASAEEAATEVRRKAVDAQARVERTRALVEEAIARVGRLTAELDEARRPPNKEHAAVQVHDRAQGSAAAPKKPSERP
jgi:hypothetical protein